MAIFVVYNVPADTTQILEIMGPHKIADYSDDGQYMMVTMDSSDIALYEEFTEVSRFDVFSEYRQWSYSNGWNEPTEI